MKSEEKSFLHIEELDEASKEKILTIRKVLFAALARNATKEECKGMYNISLAIFTEFERLTKHITDPEIKKD